MSERDDVERAREEGARILADSLADYPDNPDFVAAQRLAPCLRVPDVYTHERIAAALTAARTGPWDAPYATDDVERARDLFLTWMRTRPGGIYQSSIQATEATRLFGMIAAALRDEREACARQVEARAIALRDHGPTTPEGLLTPLAGAMVGALLDAAASLRVGP